MWVGRATHLLIEDRFIGAPCPDRAKGHASEISLCHCLGNLRAKWISASCFAQGSTHGIRIYNEMLTSCQAASVLRLSHPYRNVIVRDRRFCMIYDLAILGLRPNTLGPVLSRLPEALPAAIKS